MGISYTGNGLLLTMAAALCVALKATESGMLMKDSKRNGMTPIVVLFYDSMFSSLFLGTACMFAGETIRLGQFSPQEPAVVTLGVVVGACLAFPYKLNKFTDASEAKKWVPKSWF